MSEQIGRIFRLALALTFIVALVPHGSRAADSDAKLVMAAATDMPMSGKCDGCGHDPKAMTPAACSAYCGSFVALPLTETPPEAPPVERMGSSGGPTLVGHTIPPDPHPPRAAVLN